MNELSIGIIKFQIAKYHILKLPCSVTIENDVRSVSFEDFQKWTQCGKYTFTQIVRLCGIITCLVGAKIEGQIVLILQGVQNIKGVIVLDVKLNSLINDSIQ